MYRKEVRRRRAVLVLLVVASLVLISTYVGEGSSGPLHSVQRAMGSVLGPLEEGVGRALKPARDLVNWFDETFEARGENERLNEEVTELRARLAEAEGAVTENRELRELLGLDREGELASYEPVTARLIGRSPTAWYSRVMIDKGSSAGIERGDPVIGGAGLVGRIGVVARGIAQVRLITDDESAVSARVLPSGPSGIVEPEVGDPGELTLDYLRNDREVAEGQMLVTAGWTSGEISSAFPPGIPIGEVTEADPAGDKAFQRVRVSPFTDLRELEFVQVLAGGPR